MLSPQQQLRYQKIGKAAFLGTLFWIGIYTSMILFYILVKWATFPQLMSDDPALVIAAQVKIDLANGIPNHDDFLQLVEEINTVKQQKVDQIKQQQAQEFLNTMQTSFMKLQRQLITEDTSILGAKKATKTAKSLHIANLLEYESLSNITDATFDSMTGKILRELEELITNQEELDWSAITKLLHQSDEQNFPRKEILSKEEMYSRTCPTEIPEEEEEEDESDEEDDSDNATKLDLTKYANNDDLEELIQSIEEAIEQRKEENELIDLFFIENNGSLNKQLQSAIESLSNALDDANSFVMAASKEAAQKGGKTLAKQKMKDALLHHHNIDISHCLEEDDLFALIDVGLDALHRKKNLRSTLLAKFQELDPEEASNLILDADLSAEPMLPDAVNNPTKVNARRFIDTPILKQSAAVVDQILELMSGYNDWFDQQLDKFAEKSDGGSGQRTSLGKAFATSILKHTGRLDIPLPESVRTYFQQSEKGRNVLKKIAS